MKKYNFLYAVVAIMLAMVACVQDLSSVEISGTAATLDPVIFSATATPQANATAEFQTQIASVVNGTLTAMAPLPTQTAVSVPTQTAEVKSPIVPEVNAECSLTDGTAQIQIIQSGNEWIVDPANLQVVAGYNNTAVGHDVSKLSGCDMWVEYESPNTKEHIIVVLRDDPSKPLSYLNTDGKFYIPTPKGGSFWVGPADWNTADFSTQKPPIAYEMAAERNANQLRNGYDWPEIVYLPDGTIKTFPIGFKYGAYYTGCTDLEKPAPFYVAGTISGLQYVASIGMEGCYIAVKLDGTWTYWQNAKDNVFYTTAEAQLFPKGASESDVEAWIAKQK